MYLVRPLGVIDLIEPIHLLLQLGKSAGKRLFIEPTERNTQRPVGWDGIRATRVAKNGIVQVRRTRFHITRLLAGQTVYLIETDQHLLVFNDQGTEIMKHRWPRPGTTYVRSGRPRGRQPRTI